MKWGTRAAASAAALTLLMMGAAARAQKITFSFYSGGSATNRSDVRLVQPGQGTDLTFKDVNWRGRPFTGSIYYGYRLGTFFPKNPRLGLEIDFNHYKVYAKVEENRHAVGMFNGAPVDDNAPMESRVQEFRITNGTNTLALDLVYRFLVDRTSAFPEGRLQPYVAGGPAYYILYPINIVDGVKNERRSYQSSGWGYQLRGGVRYGLTPRFGVFAEVKYSSGHNKRVDVPGENGFGETDLQTFHSIAGIAYRL